MTQGVALALEQGVGASVILNDGLCQAMGAVGERFRKGEVFVPQVLLEQLKDTEEDHAHWLEQQLRLIQVIGEQNYLQSQM